MGREKKKLPNNIRVLKMAIRAIDHRLRRAMLDTLKEKGKLTQTELMFILKLEQSHASQQLGILKDAGFVTTERSGKYVYFIYCSDAMEWLNLLATDWVEGEKSAEEIRQRNLASLPTGQELATMTA